MLRRLTTFAPRTGKTLVGQDSILSQPAVLLLGSQEGQRIANLTGALVVEAKELSLDGLVKEYEHLMVHRRKIGLICQGEQVDLGFQFAMKMVENGTPLEACAGVDGMPKSQVDRLPLFTPVQLHLKRGSKYQHLEQEWRKMIQSHGGTHSHGFHTHEEQIFEYTQLNNDHKQHDTQILYSRLYAFIAKHLKEL